MKILIVMGGFFPGKKYGGPPVSVNNFCSLMREDECFIVTTNHDMDDRICYENINTNTNEWYNRDNCSVKYLSDNEYNKKTFEKILTELNPDIIYLQGLFQSCVLPCLQLSKKHKIRVLLAPRGELCEGAFKKKYKKIPYIHYLRLSGLLKNVYYQSTSEEETRTIVQYMKANEASIYYLTNIPSVSKKEHLMNEKKSGEGHFVFLSRIHPKKNLMSAIRYFENVRGKATFDIYGPIEDSGYWEECQKTIGKLPSNISVNYCGLVAHDEVHEVFRKYNALIFPTFSENYGHVIAEALIAGTPVIISDQTPWNDINETGAGWALPLTDEGGFANAIQEIIDKTQDEYWLMVLNVKRYIEEKVQLQKLQDQYKQCMEDALRGNI